MNGGSKKEGKDTKNREEIRSQKQNIKQGTFKKSNIKQE